MTARVDSLLPDLADELGLTVVSALAGGEFGALLVADSRGRELVLKAIPDPSLGPRWANGVSLAGRMHDRGYPAPRYVGTATTDALCWSLQTRLPGAVPDLMTPAHAERLVDLVRQHADAAGARAPFWRDGAIAGMTGFVDVLAARPDTEVLARELTMVIERCRDLVLRDGDIVHADFHQRNYLAAGDEVTGVFDWEFAFVGDWRTDLVNLACFSALVPSQVPPEPLVILRAAMFDACPPEVLAFGTAFHILRVVEFDARVHPAWLPWLLPLIDVTVAPWWRAIL